MSEIRISVDLPPLAPGRIPAPKLSSAWATNKEAGESVAEEVTEHATQMGSGTKCIRYEATFNGKVIYPLSEWIRDSQADGQKVYRRRIIVVEDWAEVPRKTEDET